MRPEPFILPWNGDGVTPPGVTEGHPHPSASRTPSPVRGRTPAYFFSLVQTRSISLVAASGQEGVKAILMSSGTLSSGASFMAAS